MELKGEYRIPAPRDQVWAMLNDPAVLRECIPGCETLEGTPGEGFSARVTTKIGPVKATFNGSVTLSNVNPPASYTISGEGKGGVAGFAKGGADVHLAADGADTVLTYVANAQVGGKLAQLGSRLIDSTARKLADQFFSCFAQRAGAPATSGAATTPAAPEPAPAGPALAAAPIIMPGEPIPPAATGVPIVEGQAAEPETVPPIIAATPRADVVVDVAPLHHGTSAATPPPATARTNAPGHTLQEAAHEVEEEVEAKAAMGFLGGPIVWGLLVILALLFVYVIAT
jgi:carbon monoxide dehydrogenase subunit G